MLTSAVFLLLVKMLGGKMFQAHQTNDLLNAPRLVDVIIQVFSRNFASLPHQSADISQRLQGHFLCYVR